MVQAQHLSETVLLTNLKKSPTYFWTIWEKYKKLVSYTAMKMGKTPEEAEDISSEVMLKANRLIHTASITNLSGWFILLTRGICINKYNADQTRVDKEEFYTSYITTLPTNRIDREQIECISFVEMLLDTLPDKLKATGKLFFLEDKSPREIAEELQCREDAVRKRVQLVREKIQPDLRIYISNGHCEKNENKNNKKLHRLFDSSVYYNEATN